MGGKLGVALIGGNPAAALVLGLGLFIVVDISQKLGSTLAFEFCILEFVPLGVFFFFFGDCIEDRLKSNVIDRFLLLRLLLDVDSLIRLDKNHL